VTLLSMTQRLQETQIIGLLDGGFVFCSETDLDRFEGDGDPAEDESDGDGVGFSDEARAAAECGDEVRAEKKCKAGEGHEDRSGAAEEQENAGCRSRCDNHSAPPER